MPVWLQLCCIIVEWGFSQQKSRLYPTTGSDLHDGQTTGSRVIIFMLFENKTKCFFEWKIIILLMSKCQRIGSCWKACNLRSGENFEGTIIFLIFPGNIVN